MAERTVCLECGWSAVYVPGGNAVVEHMKAKHRSLLSSFTPKSDRKRTKKKRRKSSDGQGIKQRRDLSRDEKESLNDTIVKWVARRLRSISIVEDEELQELCDIFGDLGGFNYKLPGRTQVREGIICAADELRDRLQQKLRSGCDYYCLTSDIWTDGAARAYISLTIHYADEQFNVCNYLLGVVYFPGKHDGTSIEAKLSALLAQWQLDKSKCSLFRRDGASNAVKGLKLLKVPHMSCITHSLHLVLAGSLIRSRSSQPTPTPSTRRSGKKPRKAATATNQSSPPTSTETTPSESQEIEVILENGDSVIDNEVGREILTALRESACAHVDKAALKRRALDNHNSALHFTQSARIVHTIMVKSQ